MSRALVSVPIPIQASDQHITARVIVGATVAWIISLAISGLVGALI